MRESHGTEAFESFTRPFWKSDTSGIVVDEPIVTVPLFSSVTIWSSILRFSTAIDVICMIARWLPCDAKMLKPVLRTRSCHSDNVHEFCERLSSAPG
jgi:hypothetical protein